MADGDDSGTWSSSHDGRAEMSAPRPSWSSGTLRRSLALLSAQANATRSTSWCRTRSFGPSIRSMVSRRELVSDLAVHDRAPAAPRPAARREAAARRGEIQEDDAATEFDALDGWSPTRRSRRIASAVERLVADAARSLHPSCLRRVVVQGDRRSGRNHRRRGEGALPQRDARGEGVSR